MKAYVLIDSNDEYCGVFASAEKATECAIDLNAWREKGTYWDSIEFLRTEMSKNGKYINVYFLYKKEGHEDEEGDAYTILIRDLA
jgi:hypothetical protein